MNNRVPTLAEALRAEISHRGTIQARAAEEMGVDPSKLTRWIADGAEPDGESLERVAAFLGLVTIFDLGPLIVATKVERARRRGKL